MEGQRGPKEGIPLSPFQHPSDWLPGYHTFPPWN